MHSGASNCSAPAMLLQPQRWQPKLEQQQNSKYTQLHSVSSASLMCCSARHTSARDAANQECNHSRSLKHRGCKCVAGALYNAGICRMYKVNKTRHHEGLCSQNDSCTLKSPPTAVPYPCSLDAEPVCLALTTPLPPAVSSARSVLPHADVLLDRVDARF